MKTALYIILIAFIVSCNNKQEETKEEPQSTVAADTTKSDIVYNTSYSTSEGEKVMRIEMTVNAPREEVWKLHTTNEGLKTFMAPVIDIEMKLGGKWEASYDMDAKIGDPANIINRVICYEPGKMFAIKTDRAPKDYASEEVLNSMFTILELEKVSDTKTKITETTVGWKDTEEYNKLWEPSLSANKMLLEGFAKRLKTGPVNWLEFLKECKKTS
jgi:uncharacterized protein YndB with AHSA1/START domain